MAKKETLKQKLARTITKKQASRSKAALAAIVKAGAKTAPRNAVGAALLGAGLGSAVTAMQNKRKSKKNPNPIGRAIKKRK